MDDLWDLVGLEEGSEEKEAGKHEPEASHEGEGGGGGPPQLRGGSDGEGEGKCGGSGGGGDKDAAVPSSLSTAENFAADKVLSAAAVGDDDTGAAVASLREAAEKLGALAAAEAKARTAEARAVELEAALAAVERERDAARAENKPQQPPRAGIDDAQQQQQQQQEQATKEKAATAESLEAALSSALSLVAALTEKQKQQPASAEAAAAGAPPKSACKTVYVAVPRLVSPSSSKAGQRRPPQPQGPEKPKTPCAAYSVFTSTAAAALLKSGVCGGGGKPGQLASLSAALYHALNGAAPRRAALAAGSGGADFRALHLLVAGGAAVPETPAARWARYRGDLGALVADVVAAFKEEKAKAGDGGAEAPSAAAAASSSSASAPAKAAAAAADDDDGAKKERFTTIALTTLSVLSGELPTTVKQRLALASVFYDALDGAPPKPAADGSKAKGLLKFVAERVPTVWPAFRADAASLITLVIGEYKKNKKPVEV